MTGKIRSRRYAGIDFRSQLAANFGITLGVFSGVDATLTPRRVSPSRANPGTACTKGIVNRVSSTTKYAVVAALGLLATWGFVAMLGTPGQTGSENLSAEVATLTDDADSSVVNQGVVEPEVAAREASTTSSESTTMIPELSEWERLLLSEALLPRVRWDFVQHAGSPKKVLANTYLNPNGIKLSAISEVQLKSIINDRRVEIEKAEAAMNGFRLGLLSDRCKQGAMESMRVDFSSEQTPEPANPEEETGTFCSGTKRYDYRINWGESAEYDDLRIKVFYSKQGAVDAIRAFVASHEGKD